MQLGTMGIIMLQDHNKKKIVDEQSIMTAKAKIWYCVALNI